ncbi:hypothetical protein M501DRAFT_1009086 [Patellaria atrata CBS 101060]|uniref:Uncharacterized protein n=1 Tax=Patellaria atrata CBS 101060 TaxID=1346257 RepID=A0A9P4S1N4_9PEZI|nr:hypothetical protein M501DRAFT_1009086 [Patellaria atrata CBS 101060]
MPSEEKYQTAAPNMHVTSNSDALILPPCPRPNYETKFDDWFTLEGCPNFDICPSCLDSIITPTEFRKYFKPASKRPLGTEIRCDFGSPWFRFAWLLTIKQKRGDLALLYALATLTETEKPCPGTLEAAGTWYTVTDDYNERVPNFRICSRDMKFLEALFPTLRSRITRTSSRDSRAKRLCSLRVQSSRFPKYIDLMVDIDSTAQRKRRKPDLGPLLNLIKENSYKPECNRDNIMLDQLWHFIPGLPEFTVCEECYEHIVYPHVRAGSSIAAKFNSTPTYAPGEDLPGPNLSSGNSCQLYSHRMRHIFAIAIEDNDIAYLVRKATERKKAELDLQGQHKRLKRLLEGRLGYGYHSGAADPVWIDQEMNRLAKLWKEWE